MQIGNYIVDTSNESYRIFPKNKKGETIPVLIDRGTIKLTHLSGNVVEFKRYWYRGKYLWKDSREPKKTVGLNEVIGELGRMFKGDYAQALSVVQMM